MRFVAFGFLLLCLAGPAQAKYGWCTIKKDGGYDTYISAVIDLGNGSDAYDTVLVGQFGRAFQGYVGQFETIVREPDCNSTASLSDAEYRNRNYALSVGQVIRTNWRGNWPPPGGNEAATSASSGPHLTINTNAGPAISAKQQEDAVLQAQREGAAALAKRIADTARAKAETQAKLDKFLDELRKRGRAQ